MNTHEPPQLSCLCFSKDRPLQLEGYIQSLAARASGPVALTVLHHASEKKYQDAYEMLAGQYPEVRFLQEQNFRRQVTRWVKDAATPLVMFGCDDVVFKEDFDLAVVAEAFGDSRLFGFSLRLGLEVFYCAMQRRTQRRPNFLRTAPSILWDWTRASDDWGYPFELCCTVYRREDVAKTLDLLNEGQVTHPRWPNWGHPNRFEALGSALRDRFKPSPLMASFPSAKGVVVTVNRVQEECKNFVYGVGDLFDCATLLDLWNRGMVMDVEAYHGRKYHSVHIGEIRLRHRQQAELKLDNTEDYDPHKVIITDFAQTLAETNSPLLSHPRLPDFVRRFDEYFHLEGAETDSPVVVAPYLDGPPPEPVWPEGLRPLGGIILDGPGVLPRLERLADLSVELATCLRAASAGLGQDADGLDPLASEKIFRELNRMVAPGGHVLGRVPVAKEFFVMFNATRVFQREQILAFFPDFEVAAERYLYPEPGPPEKLEELPDLTACVWCFDLTRKPQP